MSQKLKHVNILFHKENLRRKMVEVRAMSKTKANLPQEKTDFINDAHQKESQYGRKITLEGRNEDERKQLIDLAPLRAF